MNRTNIDRFFYIFILMITAICCSLLFFILYGIISQGYSSISFTFLTSPSKDFGTSGGIFYQIIGSLLMVFVASLIALPLSLGTVLCTTELFPADSSHYFTRVIIFGLNGIPSIIYGLFGYIFFVDFLKTGISWFVGSIILGLMIMPTIMMSSYHAIQAIPSQYKESAQALGLNTWQIILSVILPQSLNATLSGLFLGLARTIGETAPVLFIATAFFGGEIPTTLFEPVASLPTHIFNLAQQANNPIALSNAWGSSLVLISIVMIFSLSSLKIKNL
ncbi:MAG: phosphate ABC transporter, permease protein PstA [Candidatus Cloacimonadota bacterium]|nr:MAG: phosphate ABC transporter, permease protein PstA [Candidatus Cloacimonadota bacterium]